MEIPVSDGPYKGELMEREKYDEMLEEYYDAHGWDTATGLQKPETLKRLELEEVISFLSN